MKTLLILLTLCAVVYARPVVSHDFDDTVIWGN